MNTPAQTLTQKLSALVGAAFAAHDLPAELGAVRVSDRPDLAQFQCNGAMAAAKIAKASPRAVAEKIVGTLQDNPNIAKIDIAGPGFININITEEYLTEHLSTISADPHFGIAQDGAGQSAILDYGGPNIAKPMHVGHLRSSIIGDALRRMCIAGGYTAVGDVHMGDWGTPMGQIISELEERGTLGTPVTMEDLEEIYPAASKACKADETRAERARAATVKLQDGDPIYTAAWQQFIDVSIDGMKENFDALGVHFDLWNGEACVNKFIAPMVDKLRAQDLAVDSNGAVIVNVEREDDKKEMPPLILYKSDGAVMYGTTDLATLVDRMENGDYAKVIYAVDQRQSLHFEQVFRAARLGGIVPDTVELTHAGFGTMNGTDGKPFKTRAGGVMKLNDLISMGIEKAQARLEDAKLADDIDAGERTDIAHKVALAAIKFADLQNQRQSDYVFDMDRMMEFEGKTGPYMLYQAVRIKSLLKKAEYKGDGKVIITESDRALALLLTELPDQFSLALRNYTPHVLCEYAYKLAQEFSKFYAACHIMSETDKTVRNSRLALCEITYRQLEYVLDMLGINIPDRM